jgi:hypothetical protein
MSKVVMVIGAALVALIDLVNAATVPNGFRIARSACIRHRARKSLR